MVSTTLDSLKAMYVRMVPIVGMVNRMYVTRAGKGTVSLPFPGSGF